MGQSSNLSLHENFPGENFVPLQCIADVRLITQNQRPNPSSSGPNVDNKLLEQLNELKLELQTLKSNTNNQKPVNNVLEKPKQVEKPKPLQKPKEIESPKVEIKKKPYFLKATEICNLLYNV